MFHVVLVEPEIPPNAGNVIRLCANTGARLHLVKPLGFRLDDRNLKRSGLDYADLAQVDIHNDIAAALEALADARRFAVETDGMLCYSEHAYQPGDAFFFGCETRGLSKTVRERIGRERSLRIPMRPDNRSINLSNAVAVVVYEAWRQLGFRCGSGSAWFRARKRPP